MASEFKLPKEGTKVTVTPIPRGSSMIKDPNHVGYFMYPNTEFSTILHRKSSSGAWVECLTEEERKVLEAELKVDLSFRKSNKFWSNRHVVIKRTDELLMTGFDIDISTPDGYLDYKILSADPRVAPSWEKRFDNSLEYRFALVTSGEKLSEDSETANEKIKAYELYSKIKNNRDALLDFLIRYGVKPDKNSSLEFLQSQVWKIVENKSKNFVSILEDKDYELKVFIDQALTAGALKMQGRTTYTLGYGENDVIGRTLQDTLLYLKDKKNDLTMLEIKARIDNYKG